MLTQLQTPLPLQTPKGKAWAVAIIDYGPHWDLLWVTFVHDTGECWTFHNREIRQEKNDTFGLHTPSPITPFAPSPTPLTKNGHAKDSQDTPLATMRSPLNGANSAH